MRYSSWTFVAVCVALMAASTMVSAAGGSLTFAASSSECRMQDWPNGLSAPICTTSVTGTITLDGCTATTCEVTVTMFVTATSPLPGDLSAHGHLNLAAPEPGMPGIQKDICNARERVVVPDPSHDIPARTTTCSGTTSMTTPFPDQPIPRQCVDLDVDSSATLFEPPSGLVQGGPQPLNPTANTRQVFFLEQVPLGSGNVVLRTSCI